MSTPNSILFLDDCEDLLRLAKCFIDRQCGYKAITVKSMFEIEALGDRVFSCKLAILDINLGPNEPSGIDVYRWLRAHKFRAPIFFLTGHAATSPLVEEAERLGDATILSKPIEPSILVDIIRSTNEGV